MWSSSMSAIFIPPFLQGRSQPLATASLRARLVSRGRLRLRLHLLTILQLAGERAVRAVDDGVSLDDAVENLDVGAARKTNMNLAHLGRAVLVDDEHHLDRLGLARGGLGGRIGRRARRRRGLRRGHFDFPLSRGLLLLLLGLPRSDRLYG